MRSDDIIPLKDTKIENGKHKTNDMLKLAFKNLNAKPLRTVATILAVAIAVAMFFCMISFKGAVFDYIYETETSAAGNSDIVISTNSNSDRITTVAEPLKNIEEVKDIVPSLNLYALYKDEYVSVRAFVASQLQTLQKIDVAYGDLSGMESGANEDNIVVSKAAAEHFGLNVGDNVRLKLGTNEVSFYVGAIAEQSGYFLDDSPYRFVCVTSNASKLVLPVSANEFCNEIYLSLKDGANVNTVIEKIKGIERYSTMLVKASRDGAYVEEKTSSLTAPVVLAGGAVLLLGVAVIVILFLMSESEKKTFISKLTVIGATKRQIFGLFAIESFIISVLGALIGSALAVGVFVGLLKITLSSSVTFGVNALYFFLSGAIGFVSAMASSLIPVARAFKGTVRENQLDLKKNAAWTKWIAPVFLALTIVCLIIEFCVPAATAYAAVFSMVFALCTVATGCVPLVKLAGKGLAKTSSPSMRIAGLDVQREKRFTRSVSMLTVGVTVSVMLFMAWSLTTSIFSSYVKEFENMAFVSNVRFDVNAEDFKSSQGVKDATKMVWGQCTVKARGNDKTMNVLGSADIINMVDFEFMTPKETVYERISSDKDYVFVDYALKTLYGIDEGDTIEMTVGDVTRTVVVGGILKHELFSGNYIVTSSDVLERVFSKQIDTVLIVSDGTDMQRTVGALREKWADKNYYVISALDAFRWDMESMQSVFDLIGTLAVVVAIFIFAVTAASALIGRGGAKKARTAFLNAGMSKNMLLGAEVCEYAVIAAVALALSVVSSAVLTASLIHALRLFGLYFDFMYRTWVVFVTGIAMCGAYTLVPLALNFKKGYNVKKA